MRGIGAQGAIGNYGIGAINVDTAAVITAVTSADVTVSNGGAGGKSDMNGAAVVAGVIVVDFAVADVRVCVIGTVDPTAAMVASPNPGGVSGDGAMGYGRVAAVAEYTPAVAAADQAVFEAAGIGGGDIKVDSVPLRCEAVAQEFNAVGFGANGIKSSVDKEIIVTVEQECGARLQGQGVAVHHMNIPHNIVVSGTQHSAQGTGKIPGVRKSANKKRKKRENEDESKIFHLTLRTEYGFIKCIARVQYRYLQYKICLIEGKVKSFKLN